MLIATGIPPENAKPSNFSPPQAPGACPSRGAGKLACPVPKGAGRSNAPGNGAIRWRDRQGAGCEILPLGAAAAVAGIHHAALHGAIPLYPGRHDPHLLILLLREHRVKAR
jgi:hypothetical protein